MPEAWKSLEGQVLNGEFHLRQYLGGSEHSAVFLTQHRERRLQKAAIKLIPADPRYAQLQFFRWRLAAKLSHPHLIRLFQMGRCRLDNKELLYLVMEYADEVLSQVLPDRPLTPAEARDMLKPTLDALAYVHCQGFVHGHLKPANIMAVEDQLKLSSDGLCRMGDLSGGPGTRYVYDAPEAESGAISSAGDVWSLGMTLVEALTQRPPAWERAEEGEPQLPQTLPPPFFDIARNCLRRDPQRRWTVGQIAACLQPTPSVPPLLVPRRQMAARPQKVLAKWWYFVPTVIVGLTLAAMVAGPRLLNRHPETTRAPSSVSEQPSVQPKSKPRPVTRGAGPSARKTSKEEQSFSGTPPSSASLQSGAEAKTPLSHLVQGEVLQEILPDVPQKARDTIRGTVRVRVRIAVDPSGRVVGATLDSAGPSKYFAQLALQAARRWEFRPAQVDGRNVASEWVLRFEFNRATTRAFSAHASP